MKYAYQTTNKQLLKVLFNLAKENDFSICPIYQQSLATVGSPIGWEYFIVNTLNMDIYGSGGAMDCQKIELEELIELLTEGQRKFKLNEEYTAILDYAKETVSVGCQTFKFENIKELAKLLNK